MNGLKLLALRAATQKMNMRAATTHTQMCCLPLYSV